MRSAIIPTERPLDTLTPQQHAVIALLSTGSTVTAAAEATRLHRSTISYWHRTNPDFAEALRTARADRAQHWQSFADQRAEAAFHLIDQLMADDTAPWTVRFKAIQLIVTQAMKEPAPPSDQQLAAERIIRHTYAQNRERDAIEADRASAAAEVLAAEAQVLANEPPSHVPAHCTCLRCLTLAEVQGLYPVGEPAEEPAAPGAIHQNSSLFVTPEDSDESPSPAPQLPYRRPGPKVGANAPCPCGSHRKYKKCCRGKMPSTHSSDLYAA